MTDIRSALAEMVRLRSAVDRRLDPAWAEALDKARAALAAPVAQPYYPSLLPVIQWLENGGDPLEAAKELRVYQDGIGSN
jgi:hypothetical protein